MLDVGAVAARSGPPVPAGRGGRAAGAGDRGPRRAHRPAGLGRHLLGGGRRARRSTRAPSRSTTSAEARDPGMFDLAADRGCGYVLMHIEGPPREDREPPRFDDPVDHLKGWFAERIEAAPSRGMDEEQIVIDPGIDFDLGMDDGLEVLRRLGELHDLGRPDLREPLAQGPARRGARRVVGGAPAGRRARVGDLRRDDARGRAGRVDPPPPRRQRAAGDADRRRDRVPSGTNVRTAAPGSRRSRRAARTAGSSARARSPRRWRSWPTCRATSTRGWPRRWPRRDLVALLPPGRGIRDRARARADPDQRHRVREVALVQPPGARRDRARRQAARLLPLPDQGAGPGPGPEARPDAPAEPARGDLRRRHPARGAAGDPPQGEPGPDQPRHAQRRRPPPPQALGRLPRRTSAGSWSTRPTPTAASSARTSPTSSAASAASARLYGAEPRFIMASATIANPGELAERLTGLEFDLLDDDGAPRAGREIAMWNPARDRRGDPAAALGGLRGGRPAVRAGRRAACGRSAS